jgi:hypothetical protein
MRKFKNLLTLISISIICILNSCKDEKPTTTDLSGTYVISQNKPTSLPIGSNLATLTLTESKDTRCPANSYCISAGSVLATIKFKDADSEAVVNLCMGTCYQVAQTVTSTGVKYYIALTDFGPYPGITSVAPVPTTATIVISKAN